MPITPPPFVPPPPPPPPGPLWPLSVEQYHQMIDAGILTAEHPVELLEGCLVHRMPKHPLHCYVTELLRERLLAMLPAGYFADSQEPVTLSTSEPEPDVTVIRERAKDYATRHPYPGDVVLLIEVSDTSLSRDRGYKKRIYAQANISQYWIVNLVENQIEVYREPDPAAGDYRQHTSYALQQDVPVIVDGKNLGNLRLEQLLPSP